MKRTTAVHHSSILTVLLLAALPACVGLPSPGRDHPEPEEPFPVPSIPWAPHACACVRASDPPTIDGRLGDAAWAAAPWTDEFVDIEGPSKPAPRFRTRAKFCWDDRCLYVVADLEEPDVRAVFTERDSYIYQEDHDFEVFLDPDGDTHLYFELEVNALGTEWDLLLTRPYRDDGAALHGWDCPGLRTAVHVMGTLNDPSDRDRGWTVEIAIPWTSLADIAGVPCPPRPGDVWRANLTRVEWRTEVVEGNSVKAIDPATRKPYPESNWVWSPQGLIAMHYPEMWGFLVFAERAGDAADFRPGPAERARWALRVLDYRQRDRRAAQGAYADDAASLGLARPPIAEVPWPPEIATTPGGYEARLRLEDGSRVVIRQDGRVRREDG